MQKGQRAPRSPPFRRPFLSRCQRSCYVLKCSRGVWVTKRSDRRENKEAKTSGRQVAIVFALLESCFDEVKGVVGRAVTPAQRCRLLQLIKKKKNKREKKINILFSWFHTKPIVAVFFFYSIFLVHYLQPPLGQTRVMHCNRSYLYKVVCAYVCVYIFFSSLPFVCIYLQDWQRWSKCE